MITFKTTILKPIASVMRGSAVNRNVLSANKEVISSVKGFELLIAEYGMPAIFLDLGNGNLRPQVWLILVIGASIGSQYCSCPFT